MIPAAPLEPHEVTVVRRELAGALRANRRAPSRRSAVRVDDAAAGARRVIAGNKRYTPPARRR